MPRKAPNPNHVQIATLPNGGPVYGPADSDEAHRLIAGLFAGLAGIEIDLRVVWVFPDTSMAVVNGDPAFTPDAIRMDLSRVR